MSQSQYRELFRKMPLGAALYRGLLGLSAVALTCTVMSGTAAAKAAPARTTSSSSNSRLGNDISYPQCGKALPSGQAFGIAGVNGGLANTTNTCLASQLVWAAKSAGSGKQAKTQLYVNTADPGGLNTPSWPAGNLDSNGTAAPDPYGVCDGSDTTACAWQYGWNRAVEDVRDRLAPAAQSAGVAADPSSYRWWLDVETVNTWKTGSAGQASNRADLEGMVAYFSSVGGVAGLYSTAYQWSQIAGTVPSTSGLDGLASWQAGARNLSDAKSKCALPPLTAGGRTELVQYVARNVDYDYSCI